MSSFIKKGKQFIAKKLYQVALKKMRNDFAYVTEACKILEITYGHSISVKNQQAVNAVGAPLPWFTYPAIDFLDQLDFSDKAMLEWGSGNSSLFFSPKVKKLFSIEHNEEWFNHVKSFNLINHKIEFINLESYARSAKEFGQLFDIILIDGVERSDCADVAMELLTPTGVIILDNSDRYPDISERLRGNKLIQIDFHGLGPINNYTWTTSLFLTRAIEMNPIDRQPRIPLGGGY
jgi:hypothetical protein